MPAVTPYFIPDLDTTFLATERCGSQSARKMLRATWPDIRSKIAGKIVVMRRDPVERLRSIQNLYGRGPGTKNDLKFYQFLLTRTGPHWTSPQTVLVPDAHLELAWDWDKFAEIFKVEKVLKDNESDTRPESFYALNKNIEEQIHKFYAADFEMWKRINGDH